MPTCQRHPQSQGQVTLSPDGFLNRRDYVRADRNVIIEQSFGGPKITKSESHICARHVSHSMRGMLQTVSRSPSRSRPRTSLRTSEPGKPTGMSPLSPRRSYAHALSSSLVQDVAQKSNEFRDGTTTATVLARAIYSEGVRTSLRGVTPWTFVGGPKRLLNMSSNS